MINTSAIENIHKNINSGVFVGKELAVLKTLTRHETLLQTLFSSLGAFSEYKKISDSVDKIFDMIIVDEASNEEIEVKVKEIFERH